MQAYKITVEFPTAPEMFCRKDFVFLKKSEALDFMAHLEQSTDYAYTGMLSIEIETHTAFTALTFIKNEQELERAA